MAGSRIEALLASFPKLIHSGSQHTFVETESVRFVYQPLEDLYMILITTKNSNILQDIESLQLFARAVSDQCHSLDEHDILMSCFEILEAFDEIASLGYRENVTLSQIRTMLEMDSHEERIHEIIERNKELEAKEELKRRARQLEMQRRDAARRGQSGFGSDISMPRTYESTPSAAPVHGMPDDASAPAQAAPFKSKGMQLGKKPKGAALLGAVSKAPASKPSAPVPTPSAKPAPTPLSKPVSRPVSSLVPKPTAVVPPTKAPMPTSEPLSKGFPGVNRGAGPAEKAVPATPAAQELVDIADPWSESQAAPINQGASSVPAPDEASLWKEEPVVAEAPENAYSAQDGYAEEEAYPVEEAYPTETYAAQDAYAPEEAYPVEDAYPAE